MTLPANLRVMLVILVRLAVCAASFGQAAPSLPLKSSERLRESVTLHVDSLVVKQLATARDFIREKRWSQAIPLLQEIIEQHSEAIVPIDTGRYGNAADFCQSILSRFPDEGLKIYRERIDEQVRNWFEDGRRELDEQALRRVIDIGLLSSFGDEALDLLGDLAFERGQFSAARTYWQQLLPDLSRPNDVDQSLMSNLNALTYPDPDIEFAILRAKLVLCSLQSGDLNRADRELAAFIRLHAESRGELQGEQGVLAELLQRARQAAGKWNFDRTNIRDLPTFGGNAERDYCVEQPVDPLTVSWKAPLPLNPFIGSAPRPALGKPTSMLSTFPIVVDGVAYVCGAGSIHAFDTATGKPKWPLGENSDGRIYASDLVDVAGNEMIAFQGVPYFSMTATRGRVYARLGPPVLRRSKVQSGVFSEIVGLDVSAREGELVFQVSSEVLDENSVGPEVTSWCFEGAPLVVEDRVYVSARRSVPEDEIHVVCFDEETGQLVWRRRVCATLKSVPEHFSLIGHRLLTLGDGRLFLDTGAGAIACVEAASGKLLWVSTFEVLSNDESPFEFSDPWRHGLTPCVYADGMVFAAPAEANALIAFDAVTGQQLWHQRLAEPVLHLLGVRDGKLIASGRNLWALHVMSGEFAWPQGPVGFKDAKGFGNGRGVLADDGIYWPLKDEILLVDVASGELKRRFNLRESTGEQGGNLSVAGGRLLVAQPHHLVALGEAPVAPVAPAKVITRRKRPRSPYESEFVSVTVATNEQRLGTMGSVSTTSASQRGPTTERREVPIRWPVQASWSCEFSKATHVRLLGDLEQRPIVLLQSGSEVRALTATDGRALWTAAATGTVEWAGLVGTRLMLAESRRIVARDAMTGRVEWTLALAFGDQLQVVAIRDPETLVVMTERQVCAIEVATGKVRSRFVAANHERRASGSAVTATAVIGRVQWLPFLERGGGESGTGSTLLAFESRLLKRPLIVDLDAGQSLSAMPLLRNAVQTCWRSERGQLDRLLVVDRSHFLQCWSSTGTCLWTTPHPSVAAFQRPYLLSLRECVVLIEDGLFARGIDPRDGRTQWSVALGREPLRSLSESLACSAECVLTVAGSTLSGIDVASGKLRWRKELGVGDWSVLVVGNDAVCVRLNGRDEDVLLVAFDTKTGAALQSLRASGFVSQPRLLSHSAASVALLASDARVVALRSLP